MSAERLRHSRHDGASVEALESADRASPVRGGLFPRVVRLASAGVLLVRPANVVTAGADSISGFFIVGGVLTGHWWVAGRLILASMALYAGGMALNDVADAGADATHRPERPIPSGVIPRPAAACLAGALLALGLALAASLGRSAGVVGAACVVAILLYDLALKRTAIGPIVMGSCRTLNMALGMSALGGGASGPVGAALILGVYVASLTLLARSESEGTRRDPLIVGSLGMAGSVATTCFLYSWEGWGSASFLIVVAIGVLWVGRLGLGVVHRPRPDTVRGAVKWFVLSIVWLDALMVTAVCGAGAGLIVLILMVPSLLIARRTRVS